VQGDWSYSPDLALVSLTGGDPNLRYPLACAMIRACALEGEFYIAREDDELVGFCLWMPPGKQIFSTHAQCELGLTDFIARLSEKGKEYYRTTYFAEFPKFITLCLGDPKSKFWWLHTMMVHPAKQSQGVGRALMQPVREKAAQVSAPLALSTTTELNVPKYMALGLQLIGKRAMPSPWGKWPLYVFSLDPRSR